MKPRSRGPKRAENSLLAGQIPNTIGAGPRDCQTAKVRANPIVESTIPSSFVRCIGLPGEETSVLWTAFPRERKRKSTKRAVCENQLIESVTMAMSFKNQQF